MSDCGASLSDVATGLSNRAGPQKQTVVVWCGVVWEKWVDEAVLLVNPNVTKRTNERQYFAL